MSDNAAVTSTEELEPLWAVIGAVVMASARLEETLSRVLTFLAGSEEAWILFTGRPAATVVDQSLAIIGERAGYLENDETVNAVVALLKTAKELFEYRNALVHAVWTSDAADHQPDRTMPWHVREAGERLYYPMRPRTNRGQTQMWVTVSDVRKLARRLADAEIQILESVSAARSSLGAGWADPPTRSNWYL